MKHMRTTAAAVIAAAVVAGCSNSGANKPLTDDERSRISALAAGATPDPSEVSDQRSRHDLIMIDCMRAAGFSGFEVPEDQWDDSTDGVPDDERDQYGFGISTRLETYLPSHTKAAPNQYYEGLSEAQQQAYDNQFADCLVKADEQVMAGSGGTLTSVRNSGGTDTDPQAVSNALQEATKRTETDPRISSQVQKWSSCMSGEGFEYASVSAVLADLAEQARPYVQTIIKARSGTNDPEGLSLDDLFSQGQWAQIRKLQQYERRVAVADLRCGGGQEFNELWKNVYKEKLKEIANGK